MDKNLKCMIILFIAFYEKSPSALTTPPTTTAPAPLTTSASLTRCQEEIAKAVRFYRQFPNSETGPRIPACDDQGRFVTTQCSREDPSACWCVHSAIGFKRIGSDFGGRHPGIPLNCDEFGSFDVRVEYGLIYASTSLDVIWDSVPGAERYVLTIEVLEPADDGEFEWSMSFDKTVQRRHLITGLLPGTVYVFGIFAVNEQGWASYRDLQEVKTNTGIAPSVSTTSPTTITLPLTRCQEEIARAVRFYRQFPDSETGPRIPACDDQGRFVTTQCSREDQSACWCVHSAIGFKRIGSDFGGRHPGIPLNCDEFGSFDVRVDYGLIYASTSLDVIWDSVPGAERYVLTIEVLEPADVGEFEWSMSFDKTAKRRHLITGLLPGTVYVFGIFAVNEQGWASYRDLQEVKTNDIDTPENLKIFDSSATSVTIRWDQHTTPDSYTIDVINAETGEQVRSLDRINRNTPNRLAINRLDPSLEYIIEVRAKRTVVYSPVTSRDYVSDAASVTFRPPKCFPSRPLDLLYVIDTSRVPRWSGLQNEKEMFINITSSLPEVDLRTGTRVAALRSFRITSTIFHLNRFRKANHAAAALKAVRYNGSPLHTVQTLNYIRSVFFTDENRTPSYSIRQNAVSLAIVIFSGNSEDSINDIKIAGARLARFTNVIAVGIERQSEDEALSAIASRPDLKVTVPSFDQLGAAVGPILQKLCSLN